MARLQFADSLHCKPLWLIALMLALAPTHRAIADTCTESVRIDASNTEGRIASKVVLDGKVSLRRCSLVVHAAHGVAHIANGEVVRVELTGSPATLAQDLESANLKAHAERIEYQVSDGTLVLSGSAHVEHSARGSYDGARLIYNSTTGAISGSGGEDGLVHLVLKPASPSEPAQPATASSAPVPATSATAD